PLRTVVPELQRQGHCVELPLPALDGAAVAAYLTVRLAGRAWPAPLAPWLMQHTEGNPLFLVTLVTALLERGLLRAQAAGWHLQRPLDAEAVGLPDALRQLIEQQLERVPEAVQPVLAAASVAGVTFTTTAAAAGLARDVVSVEAGCEALVRQQLLQPAGSASWPDGTAAARYTFTHALYPQAAYDRLGVGRRVVLHQRIGQYLEAAYGPQAPEMAAELAGHFARGQDPRQAVRYLQQA